MPRREDELDTALGAGLSLGLGVTVRVCRAAAPVPEQALTVGERRQWRARASGASGRDWLLGRAALKALLPAPSDSSLVSFPHRLLSLTHAGGSAFAVATAHRAVAGTGVDFEPWCAPDPRMTRFFLRSGEQSTVLGLLRAWTVKEALYKAVPHNRDVTLLDVGLDDPSAPTGTARGPSDEALRYTVIDTAAGPLAAAVCLEAQSVAV